MQSALIGHSGFVGSNLKLQMSFGDLYRSTNIEEIAGRRYDLVVCAGAPAEKWRANQQPEADRASVERLVAAVEQAEIAHLVLISTVDVYPQPVGVDENTPIDPVAGNPYGRHRLLIERRLSTRFETTIVRLPGIFGPGLKKNVIYDFLHDNGLNRIPVDGEFQFYPLIRLWADIARVRTAGLRLINFATEPVSVGDIAREAFGFEFENPQLQNAPRYDFMTRHAAVFDREGAYLMTRAEVLSEIRRYIVSEGWSTP